MVGGRGGALGADLGDVARRVGGAWGSEVPVAMEEGLLGVGAEAEARGGVEDPCLGLLAPSEAGALGVGCLTFSPVLGFLQEREI